jgi:hypothetical protein
MKVKLAPGRALRDPQTKVLMQPDEVREVPDNSIYWRRRLRDGDVTAVRERQHHDQERAHTRAPAKE